MRAAQMMVSLIVMAGLLQSCALRPRYRDFVSEKTNGTAVQLLVTDRAGAPLKDVKVELSELKNRLSLTSGVDGTFFLPVEKKYLDENPVLVVLVPQGASAYSIALPPPPPPPVPVIPAGPTPAGPTDAPTSGMTP
jgi:hypothetical protein